MPANCTRRSFLETAAAATGALSLGLATARAADPPFSPKFCFCNETFGKQPFEQAFATIAESGYQATEMAPFTMANDVTTITAATRRQVRKTAESAGLEIEGLHWLLARTKGLHLTSPEREVRKKTAAYLGELARLCADLGGHMLVFGSPQQRNLAEGVTYEQGLEYAAEVLTETLPVLEKTDTTLALEPLSPKTTNFLKTSAEAVELMKKVDHPRCRMILDCVAASTESTPIPDLIRKHKDHMVHFHANDPNSKGPGFGKLDFRPIFAALAEIRFGGWISVEVFDYSPGAEKLARESIAYMRKCAQAAGAKS